MQVLSPTTAAHAALGGLSGAVRGVEDVAGKIAVAFSNGSEASLAAKIGEIERLGVLRQQAGANARVLSTVEDLFSELASMPRL